MDDMSRLEDRVAEDAQRVAGPRRPVDAGAVFAAIQPLRSPWWRLRPVFSVTKMTVAGVIVALSGGFLLVSLTSERPDRTLPAAASSGPTEVPSPGAVHVEVPEAGFSISIPRDWTFELPYQTDDDPAVALLMGSPTEPDVPFTQECHVIAFDSDEAPSVDELATEDLAPVPSDLEPLYGEVATERTDLTLPAGPTVRVDRRFDDAGVSIYYFSDGDRVSRLECGAERIVDDHWLHIAQTFEFMPPNDPTEPATPDPVTSTADLIATLNTEEYEPGVLRILDDGYDDGRGVERPAEGFPSAFVDVGPNGEVWLSGGGGRGDLVQLGEARLFEDLVDGPMEVGPDGALWAHDGEIMRSFRDGVWTSWHLEDGLVARSITVDGDAVPWVLAEEDTFGEARLLTLLPDGEWEKSASPWLYSHGRLASSPDGSLWLSGGKVVRPDGRWTEALLRTDGADWEIVDAPGTTGEVSAFAIGPGGEVWRAIVDPEARLVPEVEVVRESAEVSAVWIGLARLDGDRWSTFGAADGVGSLGQMTGIFGATHLLEVGPDGMVWANATSHLYECGGVASFDGSDWTPYLEGLCIHDLAIAPDGGVWVRADPVGRRGTVGTFVILPSD